MFVYRSIAPLFEFLHRSSSLDLLRSLRVLLGLEPNTTLTSIAVPPVENPSRPTPEKWPGPGDTPVVSTNLSSVANSTVVSRSQTTTSLTVTRSLSPGKLPVFSFYLDCQYWYHDYKQTFLFETLLLQVCWAQHNRDENK